MLASNSSLGRVLLAVSCVASAISLTVAAAPPLFLVDSTFDDAETRVFTVDPATGALSLSADLGTAFTPVLAMAAANARVLYMTGTDSSTRNLCAGERSCVLLKVVLGSEPDVPAGVTEIGPVTSLGTVVTELVGMSFRSDGRLYAMSQKTDGLYTIEPSTGAATLAGVVDVALEGGDLTFDVHDRLLAWVNGETTGGLYDLDPDTAAATVFELHPSIDFAGMAAIGHTDTLYGAAPVDDHLYRIDSSAGLMDGTVPLTLDGAPFDHKRGDLDSPFCGADGDCEDGDACTLDTCQPGGCRRTDLRASDADRDGVNDCVDACAGTPAAARVDGRGCSVDQTCPCAGPGRPWTGHDEYVSCVAAAARAVERNGKAAHDPRGKTVRGAARSSCGK
jgi:hypothetical protein